MLIKESLLFLGRIILIITVGYGYYLLLGEKEIERTAVGNHSAATDRPAWSEPVPLPVDTEGRFPYAMDAAAGRNAIYLAYHTAPSGFPLADDVWVATYREGKWKEPHRFTSGTMTTAGSRIAVTSRGSRDILHLIWGEQLTEQPYSMENLPEGNVPYHIFSSTNKTGEWSEPASLFHVHTRGLYLAPGLIAKTPSLPEPAGPETLYFSFMAPDTTLDKWESVFVTRKEEDAWMPPKPVSIFSAEPDLAVLQDGRLLLAYIRPDTLWAMQHGARDTKSLFVKSSDDSAESWSESILIRRAGNTPSHTPQLAVDGTGLVHLFWRQDTQGNRSADAVFHSWSDDGQNWSDPVTAINALQQEFGHIYFFDIAATTGGKVYGVFTLTKGLGAGGHLYFASWDGREWSTPEPLFDFLQTGAPKLAYDETNEQLHLFFGARTTDMAGEISWKLYHAVYPVAG